MHERLSSMGAVLAVALAGSLLLSAPARAAPAWADDGWWGRDKALHLTLSAGLTGGAYALSGLWWTEPAPRLMASGALGLAAGVGKELLDLLAHGRPSFRDLVWDGVGIALGLTVSWLLDRWLGVRVRHQDPRPTFDQGVSRAARRASAYRTSSRRTTGAG